MKISPPRVSHTSPAPPGRPSHGKPLIFTYHMSTHHTLTATQHRLTNYTIPIHMSHTHLATCHIVTHYTPHIHHTSHTSMSHITHSHSAPHTVTHDTYFTHRHIPVVYHSSLTQHTLHIHTHTLRPKVTPRTHLFICSLSPRQSQAWNPAHARAQLCDGCRTLSRAL